MNSRDINSLREELLKNRIEISDTISQFMEKCNNNFSAIIEWGGGPTGAEGERGNQGVPTKPKVPIHVWREGVEYNIESTPLNEDPSIDDWNEDLSDVKYQDGHLIMLKNGHVYILETDNSSFNLKPKFILALSTYNPDDVIDGKNAYVHFAYANSPDGDDDFITDQQLRGEEVIDEPASTFSLRRSGSNSSNSTDTSDRAYMGVYSDNTEGSSTNPGRYTWIKVQGGIGLTGEKGEKGDRGEQGEKGDKGDGYTGHPYTIDLEGDMSTISIDVDRTRLYDESDDYCQCIAHAYYGDENVKLDISEINVNLPNEYKYSGNNIVLKSNENSKVGKIEKFQNGNDVAIKFTPDETFVFPKNNIVFSLHVETSIYDENDGNTYDFVRDTVWIVRGIMSTFELEIMPQYRSIKLFEDGEYYPEKLLVSVYKVEDSERTIFDFNQNPNFTFLYKNYNSNTWLPYPSDGVDTNGVSCLEFKVVRYHNSTDPEKPEEMWDYEDVWVVADGKGTHYYHADLGSTESMMVLTTGEKINIGTEEEPKYCAELRNESGYSITFEPKFYDGTEELEVEYVNIGTNSGDEYVLDGTFERTLKSEVVDGITKYTLTITKVPYDIELISMSIDVRAKCPVYDNEGNFKEYDSKNDSVSFNVYISTLSNTYTIIPTVSSYNTSTGKTGDTIGCNVYKNNTLIETADLDKNALELMYVVHDGGTDYEDAISYTEPLIYGDDDDVVEDEFTASDVAIEFILYYRNKEIVRSTVPLIRDGIDGRDGDSWQYIFCRSPKYPFSETGFEYPANWTDDKPTDPDNELCFDPWHDDHKGVTNEFRYEYQAYRKWDKNNKCWGKYGDPTLYSNYSETGNGYNVLLSNPVAVIPVGDDWSVNENMDNQYDSTLVYFYNNLKDLSSYTNVKISLPKNNTYVINGNFSTEKDSNEVNKVIFKPVVGDSIFDFGSNIQYKLPITLTYSLGEDADGDSVEDKFEATVYWSLSPTKGLNDIEVFVDKQVVNTSTAEEHNLIVGYHLISSNGTKKFIGKYDIKDGNDKGYKIILTDDIDIDVLKSGDIISDWENAKYNFVENGNNRNCYVVLVDSDVSTIIDYAIVTAVNDGKDGYTPLCISTKILGYSLNENEDINNGKWVALNQLGTLTPGQAIYILNEYTWTVGPKTRSVTVTMAGTQGPDGKSRVLFYLGSFDSRDGKKPTLEGNSVTGLLDDDRCDYYIDENGQAWMRTGTAKSATGLSSGNSDNVNWKASTKVGFLQAGAITADMINTGSITANSALVNQLKSIDILAETVSGKTIQSNKTVTLANNTSGPTWQLNNDGQGYFAKGNISWDTNGNVTFAEGVKIQLKGADGKDGATGPQGPQGPQGPAGADGKDGDSIFDSEDKKLFESLHDIEGWILSDTGITSTNVLAKQIVSLTGKFVELSAEQIKSGTIDAERINADNLTIKKLNTTGSGYKSNIVIEDNQLNAYNGESLPSLTVRGDSFEKIIPGLNTKTLGVFSNSNYDKIDYEQTVATFTFLKDQNHCEIIINEAAYYCSCVQSTSYPFTSGTYTIDGTLTYNLYKGDTFISTLKTKKVLYEITNGKDTNNNGPTNNYFSGAKNPINIEEVNCKLGRMTEDTTYTLKAKAELTWKASGTGEKQMWQLEFSKPLNVVTRYAIERTDIGQNGFRTAFDSSHFVEFSNYDGDSSIMMYSNNAGIRITDKHVFIKIDGVWYQLINSSGNLKLTEKSEQYVLSQYGKISNSSSYSY
jgi:hypothetical protein